MAKPYSRRRYLKRRDDAILMGGGGFTGFSIKSPKGRAPRGMGGEYSAQRWASNKVRSTQAEISKLNRKINNYRGQASGRRGITKAKARRRLLKEALGMTESIVSSEGSWRKKKSAIGSAFDYASAMYMY